MEEYTQRVQEKVQLRQEFHSKFRNISRIMDCVGCDKCRLWGKVRGRRRCRASPAALTSPHRWGQLQILGIGTALKVRSSAAGAAGAALTLRSALRRSYSPTRPGRCRRCSGTR